MKILIAEDNRDLQDVIVGFMGLWRFDFDLASNGREAVDLAKINEGKYDLCLMDIDMPVMDGFDLHFICDANTPRADSWRRCMDTRSACPFGHQAARPSLLVQTAHLALKP